MWLSLALTCLILKIVAAQIPGCDYFDTVDLSHSLKLPSGSYQYKWVVIPPEQTGEYDFQILVDGEREAVPTHLRGCACRLGTCIRFCCHWHLFFVGKERTCTGDIVKAIDWDPYVNITLANSTQVTRHVLNDFIVQPDLSVPCSDDDLRICPGKTLDKTDKTPHKTPHKAPDKAPDKAPHKTPHKTTHKTPDKTSDKAPDKAPYKQLPWRPNRQVCQGPKNEGNSNRRQCSNNANREMWWYDSSSGSCKKLAYKGCGGNNNRYCTRDACQAKCSTRSVLWNSNCKMEKLLRAIQRLLPSNASEGRIGSIELNLWLAHLVGLPLLGLKRETPRQKMCIIIFGSLVLFAMLGYVYCELYDLYLNWHDLDAFTQNVVLSLTHVVFLLKACNTCYHYGCLKDVILRLRSLTRRCVLSERQIETFQRAELKGKLANLIYFNLVLLPSAMAVVYILIGDPLQLQPISAGDNKTVITLVPHNCNDPPESQLVYNILRLLSIICLMLTIIVYLTIPKLRNLHGYCFTCYMASLLVAYALLLVDAWKEDWSKSMCQLNGYVGYFAVMASFLWLTVISFDLWNSFRGNNYNVQRYTPKYRFWIYSLYAWGFAALLTIIVIIVDYELDDMDDDQLLWMPGAGLYNCWVKTHDWSALLYFHGPMALQIIFNITMFILTAIRILEVKRDLQNIGAREDREQRLNSERRTYTLFVRLFVIMGVTWTFEIFAYLAQNHKTLEKIFSFFDYINCAQGVIIFIMFVLKSSVLRLISNRIRGIESAEDGSDSEEEIALQDRNGAANKIGPNILN
ncbi:uncharacterized protein LOC135433950 [Drosophila montana]|uniref:uncharacterized protein LOC135433950 n=1 Tax=Drosophila montana TaxID=40370 RepID=UPI00313EE19F